MQSRAFVIVSVTGFSDMDCQSPSAMIPNTCCALHAFVTFLKSRHGGLAGFARRVTKSQNREPDSKLPKFGRPRQHWHWHASRLMQNMASAPCIIVVLCMLQCAYSVRSFEVASRSVQINFFRLTSRTTSLATAGKGVSTVIDLRAVCPMSFPAVFDISRYTLRAS